MNIQLLIHKNNGSPKFWAKRDNGDVIHGSVIFTPNALPIFRNVKRPSSSTTVQQKLSKGYKIVTRTGTTAALESLFKGACSPVDAQKLLIDIASWVKSEYGILIFTPSQNAGATQQASPPPQPATAASGRLKESSLKASSNSPYAW